MSIDNIKLTAFLIQQFYKNSLIEFDAKDQIEKSLPVSSFNILGNNCRRVIIIVENDETLYLPDTQLNFLLGILLACKLTMKDVAIMNLKENKTLTYKAMEVELKAEKIILFGVSPAQIELPFDFPLYQIQQYNKQTYITAAMLTDIQDNKAEKTKLWNCLKRIFLTSL